LPATDKTGTQFTKNDRIDPNRICLLNNLLDFLMATQGAVEYFKYLTCSTTYE